jgi:serine/threonine-protein kinase RsbW
METTRNRIIVPARTEQLVELRRDLHELATEHDVPAQVTRRIVLAIDEVVSNIMEHGSSKGDATIEVILDFDEDAITATIIDEGIPFDPRQKGKDPRKREFPKRGFGLYLIHLIVDNIEYERSPSGKNVLTLTKRTV